MAAKGGMAKIAEMAENGNSGEMKAKREKPKMKYGSNIYRK
jgi:hypothetical protein